MGQAHRVGRHGAGFVVRAVGLGTGLALWIWLCDLWLKAMARVGACEGAPPLREVITHPWRLPESCPGASVLGETLRLLPAPRSGAPFDLLAPALTGVAGQLWGLALLALASAVTIVVVRWRWRDAGDALALGVLWAGCLTLALPRLLGDGAGLTEIAFVGVPTGIGDLALFSALAWLCWRAVAERLA